MHTIEKSRFSRAVAAVLVAVTGTFLIGSDEPSQAGIQGSGRARIASVGRITGLELAALKVQGIEYATSNAQIRINGVPASPSALRLGQVVLIHGALNADGATVDATDISFYADVQGPVAQINAGERTFTVLGQTVRVTDATLFDKGIQPAGIDGLQAGTSVQVSGFTNSAGEWVASRIDSVLDTSSLRVSGTVKDLNPSARTFRINSLTVDYSAATPTGPFAAGAETQVLGYTVSPEGVLVAENVKAVTGLGAMPQDRGAVEGIVTSFTSKAAFSVNGQRVSTNANTEFDLTGGALGANALVQITGLFNANGTLLASKVTVQSASAASENANGVSGVQQHAEMSSTKR